MSLFTSSSLASFFKSLFVRYGLSQSRIALAFLKAETMEDKKKHRDEGCCFECSKQGQMDPVKVKGVADWSPPQNITDICFFLGFAGFYHYFIPNYSLITCPLIQLTQKNVPFNWDQSCTYAFKQLKSLMCVGNRGWLSHVHLRQGVARHTPLKC